MKKTTVSNPGAAEAGARHPARIRLFPVLVAGLLLCAVGLFWPASAKRRQFTVAVNIWPGAEGILSARRAASFQKTPASFMEFSWSAAVMGAFQNRVVDAAVVSLDELLRLEDGDAQPQAVLVVGISRGSDAILARPGIESVVALRGRRVGVELGSSGEHLLRNSLRKHDVAWGEIEVVPLNLPETETAYLDKEVDAVVTGDPWRVRLIDEGAVLLDDSSDRGLEMSRVLVVRRDSKNQFKEATLRLMATCLEHARAVGPCWEEKGLAAMLRREEITSSQWKAVQGVIHTPGREENVALLEQELPVILQQMSTRMHAEGVLQREVAVGELTNASLVKEVR